MDNLISSVLVSVLLLNSGSIPSAYSLGQESAGATPTMAVDTALRETPGVPVEVDGRPILWIHTALVGITPEERAASIRQRILAVARRENLPLDVIHAEDQSAWTDILAGQEIIMEITEAEARAVGNSRTHLGQEYVEIIRQAVTNYRKEHTWRNLLRGVINSLMATALLFLALFVFFRLRLVVRNKIQNWVDGTMERSRVARYFGVPALGIGTVLFLIFIVALLQVYAAFVLGSFPSTRYAAFRMNRWVMSELTTILLDFWNYLPNLAIVAAIVVTTHYLIKLNSYVFKEIQEGRLRVRGFYPDWAEPTAKLVRLLIVAAAMVVIFPYLPGSNSPAFRGISVFLGVLLSLGSTSAMAHAVSGTILTYMRSFNVGDFVRIGDTVGDVVEKTLLVTRVCTQKKEIVTIPNGSVLGGVVVNYSAKARKGGVIFHTCVSIGYNAPWKKVHELLISAALATKDIVDTPEPFVLQSHLDDFYVSYELNAFTRRPENMQIIYSDLHQNIQDKFNTGGIEINSPHYTYLRDGNRPAMPDEYVPKDYRVPTFGVHEVRESEPAHPAKGPMGSRTTQHRQDS